MTTQELLVCFLHYGVWCAEWPKIIFRSSERGP